MTRLSFGRWNVDRSSCGCAGSCVRFWIDDVDVSSFWLVGGQKISDDNTARPPAYATCYDFESPDWKTRFQVPWTDLNWNGIGHVTAMGDGLFVVMRADVFIDRAFRLVQSGDTSFEAIPIGDAEIFRNRSDVQTVWLSNVEGYALAGGNGYYYRAYKTNDGGASWSQVGDSDYGSVLVWLKGIRQSPQSPNRVVSLASGSTGLLSYNRTTFYRYTESGNPEKAAMMVNVNATGNREFYPNDWFATRENVFASCSDLDKPYLRYFDKNGDTTPWFPPFATFETREVWEKWLPVSGLDDIDYVLDLFGFDILGNVYGIGTIDGRPCVYTSTDGGFTWLLHSTIPTSVIPENRPDLRAAAYYSPEHIVVTGTTHIYEYFNGRWRDVCPPVVS